MKKIIPGLLLCWSVFCGEAQVIFRSPAQLRMHAAADTAVTQHLSYNHISQEYRYDPTDNTSPDDSVTVLVNAAGQRFKPLFNGQQINVKLFGATGSGIADDWPAIQRAIDIIVSHPQLPKTLFFPQGVYKISRPLIVSLWTGKDYAFCSINLAGQDAADFDNTVPEAVIAPTFKNAFALGFQLVRSCNVRGLVIRGLFSPNPGNTDWRAYYNRPFENWVSSQDPEVRDAVYSPYAGIAVDPFRNHVSLPPDGGYPGMNRWYRGTGSETYSGSSAVYIEDCRISGFTTDIVVSPNGETLNAENIHVRRCALEVAKVAYAVCQQQSKDNFIRDAISWDRVHTLVDNVSYGQKLGQLPYIDGWNVAGDVIEIVNATFNNFATSFANIFAETIFRIGTLNGPVSVTNSEFDFNVITYPILIPPTHIKGRGASFYNCVLRYYDTLSDKRRMIVDGTASFDHCFFDDVPINTTSYSNENNQALSFTDCFAGPDKILGWQDFKGQYTTSNPRVVAYGHVHTADGGVYVSNLLANNLDISFDAGSAERSYLLSQPLELTVDSVHQTGHAVLSGNDKYFVAVGDYLTSISSGFMVLGKVASLDRTTGALSLKYCPLGIRSGKFAAFAVYYDIIGGMFAGDLTKGSPTITNVEKSGLLAAPYVGQRLKIGNSFARPVIDAISPNTITMSIPADYSQHTATNPFLSKDHLVDRMEFQSFDVPTNPHGSRLLSQLPILFPEGSVWVAPVSQFQQGSSDLRFVCTRSGYIDPGAIGKTLMALWKTLDEQSPGGDWQTITGGSAVTVANGTGHVLVDPGSAITSFVLTLPAAPVEGSVVKIYFGGTIGSGAPVVQHLTILPNTGQQVVQSAAPGSAVAGNCFIYVYHVARKCWYREQ